MTTHCGTVFCVILAITMATVSSQLRPIPDLVEGQYSACRNISHRDERNIYFATGSFAYIYPNLRASCFGKVSKWIFKSSARHDGTILHLSVWQQLGVGSKSGQLRFMGANIVKVAGQGWMEYKVPLSERIPIFPGMFIGFHYQSSSLKYDQVVIPWADRFSLNKYNLRLLQDVIIVPTHHQAIVNDQLKNGFLNFINYPVKPKSRFPAISAIVDPDPDPVMPVTLDNRQTTKPVQLGGSAGLADVAAGSSLYPTPGRTNFSPPPSQQSELFYPAASGPRGVVTLPRPGTVVLRGRQVGVVKPLPGASVQLPRGNVLLGAEGNPFRPVNEGSVITHTAICVNNICGPVQKLEFGFDCTKNSFRGTCNEYQMRFFFDTILNKCVSFWWSGCGNNGNNFVTEAACRQMCMQ